MSSSGIENRRKGLGVVRCQIGRARDVAAPGSSGAINRRARFCGDIVLIFYDDRVVDTRLGVKSLAHSTSRDAFSPLKC